MSNTQPMAQAAEVRQSPACAGKKVYHTPRLENYGEVRELTRTSQGYMYIDTGTFPNMYSSTPI